MDPQEAAAKRCGSLRSVAGMTLNDAFSLPMDTPTPVPDDGVVMFATRMNDRVTNWLMGSGLFDALMWNEARAIGDLLEHLGYPKLAGRFVLVWVLLNHEGHFDYESWAYLREFLETVEVCWDEVLNERRRISELRDPETE